MHDGLDLDGGELLGPWEISSALCPATVSVSCWHVGSGAFVRLLIWKVLYKCPLQQSEFLPRGATAQGSHWDYPLTKDFLLKWWPSTLSGTSPPQTIYMFTSFLYPWVSLLPSNHYSPAPCRYQTAFPPWATSGFTFGFIYSYLLRLHGCTPLLDSSLALALVSCFYEKVKVFVMCQSRERAGHPIMLSLHCRLLWPFSLSRLTRAPYGWSLLLGFLEVSIKIC